MNIRTLQYIILNYLIPDGKKSNYNLAHLLCGVIETFMRTNEASFIFYIPK